MAEKKATPPDADAADWLGDDRSIADDNDEENLAIIRRECEARERAGARATPVPPFEFGGSLATGGAVALLTKANLADEGGAQRFRDNFTYAPSATPPTLAQLRVAQRLLTTVEGALLYGDRRVWRSLERARAASAIVPPVVLAVETLQGFVVERNRKRGQARRTKAEEQTTAEQVARMAAVALRRLAKLEPAFGAVNADQFVLALEGVKAAIPRRGRGNVSVFSGLASLALECGAFGAIVSNATDGGDPVAARVRIAKTFSQTWGDAGRPSRSRKHSGG